MGMILGGLPSKSMVAVIKVTDGFSGVAPENTVKVRDAIRALTGVRPEAFEDNGVGQVVAKPQVHGLLEAAHLAFTSNLDLVLAPDDLWLTIVQGLALHVRTNIERLQDVFVQPRSIKETISLKAPFLKGSSKNDWPELLRDFSDHVATSIGEATRNLLVTDFSTTTDIERVASVMSLLDVTQEFFHYKVSTHCGITHILLTGNKKDWQQLRTKVQGLAFASCPDWVTSLDQVLRYCIRAFEGASDEGFWRDFYTCDKSCVYGWINALFPYVLTKELRPIATSFNPGARGYNLGAYPKGFSRVPFIWEHLVSRIPMEFVSGFLGVRSIGAQAVKPVIGWAISQPKSGRDPDLVIPY